MKFVRNQESADEMGMAPLIDCVFLLLIFFLVSTMFKRKIEEPPDIITPLADSAIRRTIKVEKEVIIIHADGRFEIDQEEVSLGRLNQHLTLLASNQPDLEIQIHADESAPAQRLLFLLDACQIRNLKQTVLRLRPSPNITP